METCRKRISDSGLEVVLLENDVMAVGLAPEAGGKITEITDKRSGRNWLWQNPHVPIRQTESGLVYASELDSGGWDDILFSITPCEITLDDDEKYAIPDHGDLVGQAWKIESAAVSESGHAICDLTTTGNDLRYHWRRVASLHPDKPSLTLSYAVENTGDLSLPFLWCAHPLLAVYDGMRELTKACRVQRTKQGVLPGARQNWPRNDEHVLTGKALSELRLAGVPPCSCHSHSP